MKKKLIRMVSLVVCVLMISACFPVYAQSSSNEDFSIQPRWTELSTYQCSLTSHSGLFSKDVYKRQVMEVWLPSAS